MTYHINNNSNISPSVIAIIEFISVIHGVIVLSLTMLKLIEITIIVVTEKCVDGYVSLYKYNMVLYIIISRLSDKNKYIYIHIYIYGDLLNQSLHISRYLAVYPRLRPTLIESYPLVIYQFAIENCPVEIVDLPLKNGDFP
jgi:hypothetical protein